MRLGVEVELIARVKPVPTLKPGLTGRRKRRYRHRNVLAKKREREKEENPTENKD